MNTEFLENPMVQSILTDIVQNKVEQILADIAKNQVDNSPIIDFSDMTEDEQYEFHSKLMYNPIGQLFEYVSEHASEIQEQFQFIFPDEESINKMLQELNTTNPHMRNGVTYILRNNKIYHTAYLNFLRDPYFEKEMTNGDILAIYLENAYTKQLPTLADKYLEQKFFSEDLK